MIADFMNTKEAAKFSGYTQNYICNLCKYGELKNATKDMNSWYVSKEELKIYLLAHPKRNTRQSEKERKYRERKNERRAAQDSACKE